MRAESRLSNCPSGAGGALDAPAVIQARAISRRRLCRIGAVSILGLLAPVGCGGPPRPADVAALIRAGDFKAAREAAEAILERNPEDAQILREAGAMAFAAGDFSRARALFTSLQDDESVAAILPSGLRPAHWLALIGLRTGEASAAGLDPFNDPLYQLIAGAMTVEAYVTAKVAAARQVADATLLSIAASPGRDAVLDSLAWRDAPQFRCTANFAAGQRAVMLGDRAAARGLFAAAADIEVDLLERYVAGAELARLA